MDKALTAFSIKFNATLQELQKYKTDNKKMKIELSRLKTEIQLQDKLLKFKDELLAEMSKQIASISSEHTRLKQQMKALKHKLRLTKQKKNNISLNCHKNQLSEIKESSTASNIEHITYSIPDIAPTGKATLPLTDSVSNGSDTQSYINTPNNLTPTAGNNLENLHIIIEQHAVDQYAPITPISEITEIRELSINAVNESVIHINDWNECIATVSPSISVPNKTIRVQISPPCHLTDGISNYALEGSITRSYTVDTELHEQEVSYMSDNTQIMLDICQESVGSKHSSEQNTISNPKCTYIDNNIITSPDQIIASPIQLWVNAHEVVADYQYAKSMNIESNTGNKHQGNVNSINVDNTV